MERRSYRVHEIPSAQSRDAKGMAPVESLITEISIADSVFFDCIKCPK
jgi:hypothetical protein